MKAIWLSCLLALSSACASAAVAAVPPADLPAATAVGQALDAAPAVRMAMAELQAAQAERARLVAGDYEYNLRLASQRRKVAGDASYSEWNAAVERGLRLPGKSDLDGRIGEQGELAARARVADARHETARQILGQWYAVRQARLEAGLWQRQVELLAEQKRIVEIRVRRGDGAQLELIQAEAALSQAQAMAEVAMGRAGTALAELRARFPELPAPDDSVAEPVAAEGDEAFWREAMLGHNHELMAVRSEMTRARLQGRRAESNRVPDPTLGLYVANEQGGRDKIMGLSLAFALPGESRRAQARMQLAQADAMAEKVAATERRLSAEAAANWRQAQAGVTSWRHLDAAARAVVRHADLARRANELGELPLSETLQARRAALEAELAAGQARLAGNEANARLLLDAHQLWLVNSDGHDHDDHL